MAVRAPMSAGLVIVTVTPGSTAAVLSVTRPFIAPVVALTVWAAAARGNANSNRRMPATRHDRRRAMFPPCARATNDEVEESVDARMMKRMIGHAMIDCNEQ